MSCRDFFAGLPSGGEESKKRADLIDCAFPEGVCQTESVSDCSPGIVRGEEFLHRFVFSPVHIDTDGSLKTAFFSDCNTFGMSCQRSKSIVPEAKTHALGSAQIEKFNASRAPERPERSYLGVVSANCEAVRMLRSADATVVPYEKPMMAIYDTALTENPEHVDIFQLQQGLEKFKIKQARRDLALVFTRTPVSA